METFFQMELYHGIRREILDQILNSTEQRNYLLRTPSIRGKLSDTLGIVYCSSGLEQRWERLQLQTRSAQQISKSMCWTCRKTMIHTFSHTSYKRFAPK